MGNGPQTATFLDWGERDWLKKKRKKETSQTHNSSHLARFLSFSEWSVEDGLIGLFIFKERKEKEKAVFSRDSGRWEKGWGGSLQASRAGSLFLRAVWRQKERERLWLSSLAPRQSASTDWQFKNAMICYVCPRHCRENSKSITMQSELRIKC